MLAARTIASGLLGSVFAATLLACALAVQAQPRTNKTPVNVNAADVATLQTLPGIGSTLAQRITEGRPYQSPADLEKVKGLSKAKVTALKGQIVFGPTNALKTAPPAKSAKAAEPKAASGTNAAATQSSAAKPKSSAESTPPKAAPETAATAVQDKGAPPPAATSATRSANKLAPGQKININKASFKELDLLPGIGPTKAQAIVDYRTQKGPFKTIEEIQNVKGIKASSFSKVKDYIKVSD